MIVFQPVHLSISLLLPPLIIHSQNMPFTRHNFIDDNVCMRRLEASLFLEG
jgi:hypothetical protein